MGLAWQCYSDSHRARENSDSPPGIRRFNQYWTTTISQEVGDRERLRLGVRTSLELARHPELSRVVKNLLDPADEALASDETLDKWIWRNVSTAHHVSGTCKMGPASDPLAVVDQNGQVHGLDGLIVADASIMPDCIRANTNATTMLIAERIAEFLK